MSLSRSVVRNTWWNLLGWTLPILVALFAIPPLIRGLGAERFGILAVAWAVMGYFALFDLGRSFERSEHASQKVIHSPSPKGNRDSPNILRV